MDVTITKMRKCSMQHKAAMAVTVRLERERWTRSNPGGGEGKRLSPPRKRAAAEEENLVVRPGTSLEKTESESSVIRGGLRSSRGGGRHTGSGLWSWLSLQRVQA